MNRELDETIKIFLLSDKELKSKVEIQGIKILREGKYSRYDREFKMNFLSSFIETYINEINSNRENLAYTLLQNDYPKDIILKATRLTPKKLQEIDVKENKADILIKYLESRK